jgi:hypothetical protein
MRFFGLTPDQVLARADAGGIKAGPSQGFGMTYGALSFGVVSVLAYSIWAYGLIRHEGSMYAAIAAVYIGGTGLVLSRLVAGPGSTGRFALLFAVAFLAYALAWCAFWFGLKGKLHADLWGSAVGLFVMAALIRAAFGATIPLLPLFAVLFLCHTLGYYLGDILKASVRGANGKLLWGAAHGVGFGAGIGYVLAACQAGRTAQLPSATERELTIPR